MLEELNKLIEELEELENSKMSLLGIAKVCKYSKEEWEKQRFEILNEIEEVDKYFEELEKKRPKLTVEEKAYLSAVIKPFRDRVEFIKKRKLRLSEGYKEYQGYKEYIIMNLKIEHLYLPLFEEGKYYQGLELDREYDLEELGL